MNKIIIPSDVKIIMNQLSENNHKSYVVGGCCRDALLGREPKDWDICTSAKPNEMLEIFKDFKIIETGIKHGTLTVVINNINYEVTTFRIDGDYSDNRHPDSVKFVDDIALDLSRRDFTINAMAYNEEEGLIDPFNGLQDIENRLIKCVRNANDRFQEDALRMLRAIRFSAQLKFSINEETESSIFNNSNLISSVSSERINVEICKILASDYPEKIALIYLNNLSKYFLPEFEIMFSCKQNTPWHIYNVGIHTLEALRNSKNDLVLRLAILFHDTGKPFAKTTTNEGIDHFYHHPIKSAEIAKDIMTRLHFDNQTINNVVTLISYHDATIDLNKRSIKRMLNKIGEELFFKLLDLQYADCSAQNLELSQEKIDLLPQIRELAQIILTEKEPFGIKDLAINGSDMIELGYKPSKELGDALNTILELIIDNPELNTKNQLQEIASKLLTNSTICDMI
jgi:tRNA nucleotidyltransferase (CCA-adding enzyme)